MNWQSITFDWNQVRAFLVTAEEGSLSAAARALNLTQPTLSRQVAGLEDTLGVTLFERAGRALVLTETGLTLLEHVRIMGEAANAVSLAASGRTDAIEGKVTITATDMTSTYLLPPIVLDLSRTAPGISIDIVATNDIRNLQRREADIALRNAAPSEPELIARRLRSSEAIFAAAPAYLERFGPIETIEDIQLATWVGYGDPAQMVTALSQFGVNVPPDRFRYNCETGVVVWEMIKQGLGVGILTEDLNKAGPGLVRLLPDHPPIEIPLYIISHRELRNSRRIRLVWDTLIKALA